MKLVLRLRDPVREGDDPRSILFGLRHDLAGSASQRKGKEFGEEVDAGAPQQVGHEEELPLDRRLPRLEDAVLELGRLVAGESQVGRDRVPIVGLEK